MKFLKITAAALACFIALAGCTKSEFGMVLENNVITVTADNSGDDDTASAGTFVVEENLELVMESKLQDGDKIKVSFIDVSDVTEDEEDFDELVNKKADWETYLEGTQTVYGGILPGDYFVRVEVEGKATGTATISVRDIQDPDTWDKQASKEDALAAIGMESFEIPEGTEIRLGAVTAGEYRTHEGAIKVNVAYPAVDMFVYKAAEDVNGGDPTFEGNEYANEWTQDIDGITVTCYGNREGEATKTVWTRDGYSYAIRVHGLGGDLDFGLTADDLAAVVPGIQ
ncbi:MAG: hypothetical protein J6E46_05120 [Faecalicoccus sp.]|nr:hypothetical protein [Faecalicoccus sp.]